MRRDRFSTVRPLSGIVLPFSPPQGPEEAIGQSLNNKKSLQVLVHEAGQFFCMSGIYLAVEPQEQLGSNAVAAAIFVVDHVSRHVKSHPVHNLFGKMKIGRIWAENLAYVNDNFMLVYFFELVTAPFAEN